MHRVWKNSGWGMKGRQADILMNTASSLSLSEVAQSNSFHH